MHRVTKIRSALRKYRSKEKARVLQRFFKTGPGEYGEGDVFLGVVVPDIRTVAKQHRDIPLSDVVTLLKSPIHEERLTALLIFILQYQQGAERTKKKIYTLYLRNTAYINNWDLVDLTAEHIVGAFLEHKEKKVLRRLATSRSLWERRIAIIATFHFIKEHTFKETLTIARMLLRDEHDLIHKAVGWMLREMGKRDRACEERFLQKYYKCMPRTMLRYAIERFPERKRGAYLKGKVK